MYTPAPSSLRVLLEELEVVLRILNEPRLLLFRRLVLFLERDLILNILKLQLAARRGRGVGFELCVDAESQLLLERLRQHLKLLSTVHDDLLGVFLFHLQLVGLQKGFHVSSHWSELNSIDQRTKIWNVDKNDNTVIIHL